MNVASLSLCKELCELSGWEMPHGSYHFEPVDGWDGNGILKVAIPAYDLGYLLRKLPRDIGPGTALGVKRLGIETWVAYYHVENDPLDQEADTPEDAVAKLAVELFNQGVLKKGE